MNSQNHIMLGSIDAWFYRALAGLSPLEPGWRAVRVRPRPLGDLAFVEARVDTVSGRVAAAWRRTSEAFTLEATVPVGSSAEVHVPLLFPGSITESGRVVWPAGPGPEPPAGVGPVRAEADRVVFQVSSGVYRFELKKAG